MASFTFGAYRGGCVVPSLGAISSSLVMQVAPGSDGLRAAEVDRPAPGPRDVLVRVEACGVCAADLRVAEGTPGHEIAGTVAAFGAEVEGVAAGDRVAVGWFGGSCGHCACCRSCDPVHCAERRTPGVHYPGGYAQHVLVPADAVVSIPDALSFAHAAPFGCAGVTTFNAINNAGLRPGARVAVFGLGGLGHLAVQFAAAMGHETIAIARGAGRAADAERFGAARYVDATREEPAKVLADLGGADLILYSASSTAPAQALLGGLATRGRLTFVGVDAGELRLPVADLVMHGRIVTGHLTGSPHDIAEAMAFAARNGVAPAVEPMRLADAGAALARLEAGDVRYRVILEPWSR
jgi:D-arabinose 1-dehydrogenase-like Zn-dependent alcohol dehydrogenase